MRRFWSIVALATLMLALPACEGADRKVPGITAVSNAERVWLKGGALPTTW